MSHPDWLQQCLKGKVAAHCSFSCILCHMLLLASICPSICSRSLTSTIKIDGQIILMETVIGVIFKALNFSHKFFDPLSCTETHWLVDKVMIEPSLPSVLICDIHTARFPLDSSQAEVCPCTLFRVCYCPH